MGFLGCVQVRYLIDLGGVQLGILECVAPETVDKLADVLREGFLEGFFEDFDEGLLGEHLLVPLGLEGALRVSRAIMDYGFWMIRKVRSAVGMTGPVVRIGWIGRHTKTSPSRGFWIEGSREEGTDRNVCATFG